MPNLSSTLLLPGGPGTWPPAPPRLVILVAGAAAAMPACLQGLLRQHGPLGLRLDAAELGVVLAPDTSPAAPAAFLASLAARLPFPLRLAPPGMPGADAAGWAWHAGLTAARDWCGPRGVILTLEATAVPEPGWAAALAEAIAAGATVATATARPSPGPLGDYAALLAAIAARLDPEAGPEPLASSLAFTAASLAGPIPAGGSAALLRALEGREAAIHAVPAARIGPPMAPAPERLGPACRRLLARAALRRLWQDGVGQVQPETPALWSLARRCGLPAGEVARLLGARNFGAAWAGLEAACPALRPLPLAPGALRAETRRARLLLAWLRLWPQRAGRPGAAPGAAPGGVAGWVGICID